MACADIIVIGGGIAGLSAAAMLSLDAKVLVLEQEVQTGYHSTGRSAATFIRNYGNATLRALNIASEPVLIQPDGISDSTLLSPRGQLLVASEDEVELLTDYASGANGLDSVTPDEAVDMLPILKRDRIAAALYEASAQDIDVDRLLRGFIRLFRQRGGRIETGSGVGAINRSGGMWRVSAADQTFEAPFLVNAAGAWADELAVMAGVRPVGLQPYRRSAVLLTVPKGVDAAPWPLVIPASENWYAKPDAGKLLVSPADEDAVAPQDAWPDDLVLAEGLDRFERATTFPVSRPTHSWAGLRSFVSDRTPVVGFAPDAPGFFWLAGQGGYGVQTSPALAALTHVLCTGARPALAPEVVAALSPARFAHAT